MKKIYEKPEIEIEEFEVEDVITISGAGSPTGDDYGTVDDTYN